MWAGREYLVHADYLVNQVSVTSLVVEGGDRLGYLTFFQVLDSQVVLRLQLVYLKIGRTCVGVCHLAAVGTRGRILGEEAGGRLEGDRAVQDRRADAVQAVEGLVLVGLRVAGLDQDVAGVEHIALRLQDLDDMEAVGGLHDLGDIARLESHRRVGEGRPEDGLGGSNRSPSMHRTK